MIKNDNFKQIEHLILEMTHPFNDNEQIEIACLCCRMAKDNKFEFEYTSQIKSLYVHNYLAIKNGTYKKVNFTTINKEIIQAIERGGKADLVIDPTLNKKSISSSNKIARIQSIKTFLNNDIKK